MGVPASRQQGICGLLIRHSWVKINKYYQENNLIISNYK